MAANGDDRLLDETLSTHMDKQEWTWFIVDLSFDQRHNIKIIFYHLFIRRGE